MQVKFADGTVLDVLVVNGKSVYFQGAQRDSLEIQLAKTAATFDALDTLTGNAANTGKLTLIDGDNQGEYDNYSIRVSLSLKSVEVPGATPSDPPTIEDRYSVALAQKTYLETQLEENSKEVVNLRASYWALEASANERFKTLEVK